MTDEQKAEYRAAVKRAIAEGKPPPAPWTFFNQELPKEGDHLMIRAILQRAAEIRRQQTEEN